MKAPAGTLRTMAYMLFVLLISAALAACGGGGGSTSSATSPAVSGPATLDVSIAAADVTGSAAPPVLVGGSATVPSADSGYLWPNQVTPGIAHVYMEIVKVSLMPTGEAFDSGDMVGEMQNGNSPDPAAPPDKPGFITSVVKPPICIDLLRLENGRKLARLLNRFDQIPAGTYDKVRVYYNNVVVILDDSDHTRLRFHPTANSKFDIHFRQGHELVIPVGSDTTQTPVGWVKFFRVKLDVVGLKLMIVGGGKNPKGPKVILRPQIFAEAYNDILYSVAGTAFDVPSNLDLTLPNSGKFNVRIGTVPTEIPVAFDNNPPPPLQTTWAVSDNVLGWSSWIISDVNPMAEPVFRNGAMVMAIGPFDPSLVLQATDIVFSFPDVREGMADNVWIPPDNTAFIIVWSLTDNVTVFPRPNRTDAYFDNLASLHNTLDDTYLDNNLRVRARGYFADDESLDAYWISIGGLYP